MSKDESYTQTNTELPTEKKKQLQMLNTMNVFLAP